MTGTFLKCDCHGTETLAMGKPQEGVLEVRDRRHGTSHGLSRTLPELVRMLDPKGTSFVARGRS